MKENLIVIPDTHGQVHHVRALVDHCKSSGLLENHRMVFLGDYYDRGYEVKELVDMCIELQSLGHVFLAGNHEYTLKIALDTEHSDWEFWLERWIKRYEQDTLISYGITTSEKYLTKRKFWEEHICALGASMPSEHLEFIFNLPLFHETDEYIMIHAGLNMQPWEIQREFLLGLYHGLRGPEQLFSARLARELDHGSQKIVISGHEVVKSPIKTAKRLLLHGGVDVGGPLYAWISSTDSFIKF